VPRGVCPFQWGKPSLMKNQYPSGTEGGKKKKQERKRRGDGVKCSAKKFRGVWVWVCKGKTRWSKNYIAIGNKPKGSGTTCGEVKEEAAYGRNTNLYLMGEVRHGQHFIPKLAAKKKTEEHAQVVRKSSYMEPLLQGDVHALEN